MADIIDMKTREQYIPPLATIADAVEVGDKDVRDILRSLLDNYTKIKAIIIGVRHVDTDQTDLLHNCLLRDTKIAMIADMEELNKDYDGFLYIDESEVDEND